ncbi:MAG: hypothetical protein R3D51_00980 [Hyphomicrobiaceae bacterium]
MKLEDQVCSLELAKRLKELGVKQDSYFDWEQSSSISRSYNAGIVIDEKFNIGDHRVTVSSRHLLTAAVVLPFPNERQKIRDAACSAFTVAELGDMLPKSMMIISYSGYAEASWCCELNHGGEREHREYADTEADARAKMLTYLVEHDLITKTPSPKSNQ